MKYLSLTYEHPEELSLWMNPDKKGIYVQWVMSFNEKRIAG